MFFRRWIEVDDEGDFWEKRKGQGQGLEFV